MHVIKRDGRKEPVMFDKISSRIRKLCYGLDENSVDPPVITKTVMNGIYSGVSTIQLDNLAAETAIMLSIEHPDYAMLAARIAISNLHKETTKSFSDLCAKLRNNVNSHNKRKQPLISENFYNIVLKHSERLNSAILHDRDFSINYFGFKTLEEHCLFKIDGKTVERPQHMLMRNAIAVHGEDIDSVIEYYNLLSERVIVPDIVSMRFAGFPKGQMLRAYSISMRDDSIEGICDSLEECAFVTRAGGEVGFNTHCIRSTGSYIAGTNGTSNGLVPMLRVFNDMSTHVHQAHRPENAKVSIFLEPWHYDILDVLNLKKETGKEEQRAKALNYAVWIPDIFMRRVEEDKNWSLMCPRDCPGLFNSYGKKFEELYTSYEEKGKVKKEIKARKLWLFILELQMEIGGPCIMFKDSCNQKSNQSNVGILRGSNYSGDCLSYSDGSNSGAVPSAVITLNKLISEEKQFDFSRLKEVVKKLVGALNAVIDNDNFVYESHKEHTQKLRPIEIGVQGFADTLIKLRMVADSDEAFKLNKLIFEDIYYNALEASCELAIKNGSYDSFADSPLSKGILQYDMWDASPSNTHDWKELKERIAKHGVRNSLFVGLMPTPLQSDICNCSDSFDFLDSNVLARNLKTGVYQDVNKYLLKDLTEQNLWSSEMKIKLIESKGSIQNIDCIPQKIKDLYKTKWEISPKTAIKMAIDRAPFIDHSQSLRIYMSKPNLGQLNTLNFDTWRNGLKTGVFQLFTDRN